MEQFPFIVLFFLLMVLIIRPFTVLFHELGHAIPAVLLTRRKVTVYIGSYGDPKNSFHFKVGLLEFWFKNNPLRWYKGLCAPSSRHRSVNQAIIFTLSGPLASISIALMATYMSYGDELHGFLKLVLIVFLGSAVLDLFMNLIPNAEPIVLFDGKTVHNDGYQLMQLFLYKQHSPAFREATELYEQKNFTEAAGILESLLKRGGKDPMMYRLAISSWIQVKNYRRAKELSDAFLVRHKPDSDDYGHAGIACTMLNLQEEALIHYDKSLALNPKNKYSLNNKGYALIQLNKFEEAIPLLDLAIQIDQDFAYSYSNRGLARIKTGKTEEGLHDLDRSFKLDGNNSYTYRNLGIYHLDQGEHDTARYFLYKAKELDSSTHTIDELIDQVK